MCLAQAMSKYLTRQARTCYNFIYIYIYGNQTTEIIPMIISTAAVKNRLLGMRPNALLQMVTLSKRVFFSLNVFV